MANAQARATFLTEGMIGDLTGKCVRGLYSDDDVNVERVYYLIIVEIRRKTNVIDQGDMEIVMYGDFTGKCRRRMGDGPDI